MSISSVAASPPVHMLQSSEPKAPDVKTGNDANNAVQPPAPAPLPPGQGTRIDQIV
jgi:hypothetical protein